MAKTPGSAVARDGAGGRARDAGTARHGRRSVRMGRRERSRLAQLVAVAVALQPAQGMETHAMAIAVPHGYAAIGCAIARSGDPSNSRRPAE